MVKKWQNHFELQYQKGKYHTDTTDKINGKTYKMEENIAGITQITLRFNDYNGEFLYKNAQGNKCLKFGIGKNEFSVFPEEGYSLEMGGVYKEGNYYKCAASAAWIEDKKLAVNVQIIDEYFGKLQILMSFNDEGEISVLMKKFAEGFLGKYKGYLTGKMMSEN